MYTDETLAEAVDALTDDGDTYELPDGATLVLRIEPDECGDIEDFGDCYGIVRWGERNATTGRDMRPDDFDGNAEKIDTRDGPIWWQPPADVKRGTETFDQARCAMRDLLEYGLSVALVEYRKGTDAYGKPIVLGFGVLGGLMPFDNMSDLGDYLGDLIGQAIDQATDSAPITAP
jgi:hypothetical protein